MQTEITKIKAEDGLGLNTYIWMPNEDKPLKAILLLVHGSVEHAQRYERFANYLTQQAIGVYAFDLRGHGKTTNINSPNFAHIPYKTGWEQLLNDVKTVHNKIKTDFPNLPLFLFGHSMGSFIVRDYIANYSSEFNGLILSGTTLGNKSQINLLLKVAKLMMLFYKPEHKSQFLHNQVYANLSKAVKNAETPVDFISTDKNEVQKYLQDELSGQTISIGYAHEMGKGLLRASNKKTMAKTPKDLPLLMISGEEDPVGGKNAKEVTALYNQFQQIGLKKLQFKLYENARHELLNEVNREEVMQDIVTWVKNIIEL